MHNTEFLILPPTSPTTPPLDGLKGMGPENLEFFPGSVQTISAITEKELLVSPVVDCNSPAEPHKDPHDAHNLLGSPFAPPSSPPDHEMPPSSQPTLVSQANSDPSQSQNACTPATPQTPSFKRPADPIPTPEQPKTAKRRLLDQVERGNVRSPFKSPLLSVKSKGNDTPKTAYSTPASKLNLASKSFSSSPHLSSSSAGSGLKKTGSASRAFRSPLLNQSASKPAPATTSSLRVVALERKLQMLKQAHKIVSENSEEDLERLTKKWTRVAREAAEDMWGLVRDAGSIDAGSGGGGDGGNDWGYEDKKPKTAKKSTENWGWDNNYPDDNAEADAEGGDKDEVGEDDAGSGDETKVAEWTLGAMLTSMGIPPESLGWNEEEGEFSEK